MGNYSFTFDSDRALNVLGVPGRLTERTTRPGDERGELWFNQRWISERRPVSGYGAGAEIQAELRFDSLHYANRSNGFAITGEISTPTDRRRGDNSADGCIHDEIAAAFPELAPLIRFHLFDTGTNPMHGVANAVYLAGTRDCHGLDKGESKPIAGPDGIPHWELQACDVPPGGLSDTPTGEGYAGRDSVPLFILKTRHKGDAPPATVPTLRWVQSCRIGEGKARDLDSARRAAAWPEATDAELMQEPAALRAVLEARVPGLIAEFRAAMDSAGLAWSPAEFKAPAEL